MKKEIGIELKMSELIYDIQNKTYLTGRSAENGSNSSHVANMQANDDDENAAQILRSITMAFSVLRSRFSEYIESNDISSTNDPLNVTEDLSITLKMPSNFNSAVAKTLGETAHQFIVAKAIADWFAITAKGETADYTAVAEESLRILEDSLCKRSRPVRNREGEM